MSLLWTKTRRASVAVALALAGALTVGTVPASATPAAPDVALIEVEPGDPADAPATEFSPGKYVVTLERPPIASYQGGEPGIPATRPAPGQDVDVDSPAAQQYAEVLEAEQVAVAEAVAATPDTSYTVALNGFAADLSAEQAQAISAAPGVLAVVKDSWRSVTDDRNSADFLKLTGDGGLWSKLGGPDEAGKGVVIGVFDTGIWPENPSFAGAALGTAPDPAAPYQAYREGDEIVQQKANGQTFRGVCQAGEEFSADLCNSKVISARYFGDNFLAATPPAVFDDYLSPRDGGGHGAHTAGTAAGNEYVPAIVDNRDFGTVSGVAPGASIAVYKVLWSRTDRASESGLTSDIVAGIDQAVADNVDVINYSIGSGRESPAQDPVGLAFLSAASAGIFVSASAGNSGPGPSTMDNTYPWVTTVGASTVGPREGTVTLGNGAQYAGASTTVLSKLGPTTLVAAERSGASGATPASAALCTPGTLDPAKVRGAIVQCDRGVVDRVAKSAEVLRAGGVGMILTNLVQGSVDGDLHSVPSVHVNVPAGPVIKEYAKTAGATATLDPGNLTPVKTAYPQMAGFSSRGPALQANGDTLKPDLTAPGVTILAAVAPPTNRGRNFDFYSGTSMSAPHVAGLAAIHKRLNPTWSPMAIKSALMTTAYDTKNADGSPNTNPFAQGAGHVDPSRMADPGLYYDASDDDWLGYLEGVGVETGTGVAAIDPSDYNQASIAVGDLVGTRTITREVTSTKAGLFRAQVQLPGVQAVVQPSILSFNRAGETKTFRVNLRRTSAALGAYATGFLTWSGGGTTARSPIAVKPLAVQAPASAEAPVNPDGTMSATWNVRPGVSGRFPITANGLADGNDQAGSVTSTTSQTFDVAVPAGTKLARFATFVPAPTGADVDLAVEYVRSDGSLTEVGSSGGTTETEVVDVFAPAPGTYRATVNGYSEAPGTSSTPFAFRNFLVGTGSTFGNFAVDPAAPVVSAGQTFPVTASASGLDPAQQYLGWVEYPDGSGTLLVANPGR